MCRNWNLKHVPTECAHLTQYCACARYDECPTHKMQLQSLPAMVKNYTQNKKKNNNVTNPCSFIIFKNVYMFTLLYHLYTSMYVSIHHYIVTQIVFQKVQ